MAAQARKAGIIPEAVLILAPTGRDAPLIAEVLQKEKISASIFSCMHDLCVRAKEDCGAILLAEEALQSDSLKALNELLQAQEPWSDLPLVVMTTGGETTTASLQITKELSPAGNVTLLERPFRPITIVSSIQVALRARRRQYEVRDLLQKQVAATEMRDDFISIASHELKTPLTSLKLMTQLNQRRLAKGTLPASPEHEKLLIVTSQQVERLVRLVEDMLDVSRLNTGKLKLEMSPVDLSELVNEIVNRILPQIEAAGCEVALELKPQLKGIWDLYRIEQVIINLLTNAILYAPGKPISVKTERIGTNVRLTVKDQGPGIAAVNQERIFQRFERASNSRNRSGLGLGLYICKQIVEGHHGSIHVESAESKGSSFIVELPAAL